MVASASASRVVADDERRKVIALQEALRPSQVAFVWWVVLLLVVLLIIVFAIWWAVRWSNARWNRPCRAPSADNR